MILPFLKWPGGKRLASARLSRSVSNSRRNLLRAVLGSRAVFFMTEPSDDIFKRIRMATW